jgi:hypothetical protein
MKRHPWNTVALNGAILALALSAGCKSHAPVPVVSSLGNGPLPTIDTTVQGGPAPYSSPYSTIRPFIPQDNPSAIVRGPEPLPLLAPTPGMSSAPSIVATQPAQPSLMAPSPLPSKEPPILPPKEMALAGSPTGPMLGMPSLVAQSLPEKPLDLVDAKKPESKPVLVLPAPKAFASAPPESPKLGNESFVAAPSIPTPPLTTDIVRVPASMETKPAFRMPLKSGETYGHSPDYRWVAGVLDRHQKGNYYTIRYADFSENDRWGGKVRLVDDEKLRDYQNGDVIYIEGELLVPSNGGHTDSTAFPPFRVTEVKLVRKSGR